jgi:integrase
MATGKRQKKREVPTLADFASRFLEGHAEANRQKPSGIAGKETILRVHLVPLLGHKRLDAIGDEDVQRLKSKLKVAVQWSVLERMPCTVGMLKVAKSEETFHDFEDYARLVDAARRTGPEALLCVLLGGDAGLRCGEMMALRWSDVDLPRHRLTVRTSEWKGQVTAPKGMKSRHVPLTRRLEDALRAHRHLRGGRVLATPNGTPYTQKMVRNRVLAAAHLAQLADGRVHVLRHTFCSHLAMRGVPGRAIQELAGHADLSTTMRYMHLSPAAIESAIRLLEEPIPAADPGNGLATGTETGPN